MIKGKPRPETEQSRVIYLEHVQYNTYAAEGILNEQSGDAWFARLSTSVNASLVNCL